MNSASTQTFRETKKMFFVSLLLCLVTIAKAQQGTNISANLAGWKTWIGIDDDWNQNYNWNGGVPTIDDSVIISRGNFSGSFHPVIKSGINATAYKLRVENDTLEINAPVAGSLTVNDSAFIKSNGLVTISTDSVMLSNGRLTNSFYLPFRQSFREQKMQLMYKTSEFLAMGIHDGDVIDKLCFPVRTRRSTLPYQVTISMYYATNSATYPDFTNTGFTSPLPAAPTNILAPQATAPVVVYSGNIDLTGIPLNGSGTYVVNLATPFTFSSANNYPLIIEICYSNPATTLNDDTWQTQTVGYKSVLLLANLGTYSVPACSWTNTAPNGTALTQRQANSLRPNICFQFQTPYDLFPINVNGNWKNNGNFNAGKSRVAFNGSSNQFISGASTTSFYDLEINNSSGVKLFTSPSVSHVLNLQTGKLNLNSYSLSILNPDIGAIVRTSGNIQSETTPPNYGTVQWIMGKTAGTHIFPFATSSGTYIPLTYNLTSGDVDTVKAATYHTSANNLPFPTEVINVNDTNNVDNSAYTVDRFWYLSKTGPSGKVKIKFAYLNSEAPAPITNGNIHAQRYGISNDKWRILPYNMINTLGTPSISTSEVLVIGVTGNNLNANIWALADAFSPLRLENNFIQNKIEIAPNPFKDKISISFNFNTVETENILLSLYSVLGDKVDEAIIPAHSLSNKGHIEWHPENLKNGIYFLVFQTKHETQTKRVIKIGD